jgi:hypothetical protein
MPPRHDHHHNAHQWLVNTEGHLTSGRIAELYHQLGDEILTTGAVQFKDIEVKLPDEAYTIVRHERSPSGKLVLRVEIQWRDGDDSPGQHPISEFLSRGGG